MIRRLLYALAFVAFVASVGTTALAQQAPEDTTPQRRELIQRLRQRWQEVVRNRLGLTDVQVRQLQETTRHYNAQRMTLNQQERQIRREMRDQVTGAAPEDDKHLAALIDSILDIQRLRLELVRNEQRELSLFLTPLQRVKYLALQEQLRQQVERLRQGALVRGEADDNAAPF
jgi:hypothetical protein